MRTIYKSLIVAALVLAPCAASAQAVDLAALQAQIAALQAQIAARTAGQTAQATAPGAARCATIDATIQRGDSGTDVTDLQNFLIGEGLLEGNATGFFGTLTEAALKEWQTAHSIDPLGIAGPLTRAAINAICGSSGSSAAPLVSNQCPTIAKPQNCANGISVQLNGCTVGWQCSVATLPEQTFSATPTTGPVPLVVKFSGIVTSANQGFCEGNFCAATLVFGDGSTGAVPLPNTQGASISYQVNHTYTKGGDFIANLYQGNAGSAPLVGNGVAIKPIAPVVATNTAPTITITPNFGNAPLPVTVIVGNITSGANLSIEFGDGSFASVQQFGTTFGATHTYGSSGSYTVKLRRTNGSGDSCVSATCQVLASAALTVTGGQVASASLVANPNTGLAPLQVTFFTNGASAAYIGGVVLDFGDNTTEILCLPNVICNQKTTTHTYASAGTYNAQLLSLSSAGTTVLKNATVTVVTPGNSSLSAAPTSGPVPLAVTFTGSGGNQTFVNGVVLKYGDGSSETFCAPNEICIQKTKTHTYTDGSQYGAQLIGLKEGTASTTLGTAVVTATGGPLRVKVTGPTGTARKGDSVPLTWTVLGTKPTSGSISFDLYTQAGARIGTILTITNFQSGAATWKIPSSLDTSCSSTQPNGLCGVSLTPGTYKIQANTAGLNTTPDVSSDATFVLQDELITAAGFTVTAAPSSAELGKSINIKYRVANPPYNSGVALWLVKPTGEQVGLISGKLEADKEQTTYPWTVGQINTCPQALFNPNITCSAPLGPVVPPGEYHILAKVYAPFSGNYLTSSGDVTVHAIATSTAITIKAAGSGGSCVVLTSNLGPGDTDATTGGDVSRLQQFLAQDSDIYPEGTVSGFYGNATRRAVERYQSSHGIVSSGTPETNGYGAVGPSTRAAIAKDCGDSTYLFRATPKTGRAPLSVTFSAKAGVTGPLVVDFGDGSSGQMLIPACGTTATSSACTAQPPTLQHTYPTNGTYIAKLIKQNPTCSQDSCTPGTDTVVGTASVTVTNVTTPPPQTCTAITHVLGSEDTDATTGGDVSRLQQFLAADTTLYPEGLVTGFYGPATARAVGRYQTSKGITSTGSVGPTTLAAIRCTPDTGANGIFSATPQSGATPLLVRFATDRAVTTGSYRVDFGDGATQWLSGSSTSHTYNTTGTYTASLVQSVGNCYGLTGAALQICEIGNTQVLATKTISVAQPATMSVAVTPTSVAMGNTLAISWTTGSAPAGAKVRLEAYRDGTPEPDTGSNNSQGLTASTSELPASGSFSWTIPTTNTITVDGGWGGFVMAPGTYHITAKLYTGSACWGFCNGVQERTVNAVAKSSNFTVTAVGTPGSGGGGPVAGEVNCTNNYFFERMLRVFFSDGTSRDFAVGANPEGAPKTIRVFADFPATPVSAKGFTQAAIIGQSGWTETSTTVTGQTSASISISSAPQNTNGIGNLSPYALECTISWH